MDFGIRFSRWIFFREFALEEISRTKFTKIKDQIYDFQGNFRTNTTQAKFCREKLGQTMQIDFRLITLELHQCLSKAIGSYYFCIVLVFTTMLRTDIRLSQPNSPHPRLIHPFLLEEFYIARCCLIFIALQQVFLLYALARPPPRSCK